MQINKLDSIKDNKPFIIAGPCSAESRFQVIETAKEIVKESENIVKWFRAGVWKPRTRPSDFEGAGKKALQWLAEVKQITGLSVCTEVIKPNHIEKCLESRMDGLWIGARTTANPYLVQELANTLHTLSATNIPIFVKNPLNPDLNLWIGAMERFYNAGCTNIIAVHRGFCLTDNGKYRNTPLWQIPIELKRLFPDLFLICDPSHIAGKNEYVQEISQMAMNLSFDGLMIEVHNCPASAKTDSKQQLNPSQLKKLLTELYVPNDGKKLLATITSIREKIDCIDTEIISLLQQRMQYSEELAKIKWKENMSLYQPQRWKELLQKIIEQAKQKGLSEDFIKSLFEQIHEESINVQNNTVAKKPK
ncbi:MAG: chorismate mutase [Bacteroidales bacterium]|jgi:chorismate mutase|nr:chorismate mutase [Bacteroidales bacterium]